MPRDFLVMQNIDATTYFLKREGEEESGEFRSLSTLLNYVRACSEIAGSKVLIFDFRGLPTISFPAWLSLENEKSVEN